MCRCMCMCTCRLGMADFCRFSSFLDQFRALFDLHFASLLLPSARRLDEKRLQNDFHFALISLRDGGADGPEQVADRAGQGAIVEVVAVEQKRVNSVLHKAQFLGRELVGKRIARIPK